MEGGDKGRERDIGCSVGGGRGQGAGARYRVRGRCAVEGGDNGRERDIGCADGARWRAGTRGGSAISGAGTVRGGGRGEGGDKGRERDIGCVDGAKETTATAAATRRLLDGRKESCGLPFCQYSLRLGFRVPGLTLSSYILFSDCFAATHILHISTPTVPVVRTADHRPSECVRVLKSSMHLATMPANGPRTQRKLLCGEGRSTTACVDASVFQHIKLHMTCR